ncbi:MAG TPA: LptA/OstA family protein [Candidatus Saccharimonadales bacterium]|nr:LptA/OstA family protein [Candidatus Saccharimonadales bacterium]
MKIRQFLFLGSFTLVFATAQAQVPREFHLQGSISMPSFRYTPQGKILDMIITGTNVAQLDQRNIRIDQFEMKTFRDGDAHQVQIIAQAPHCQVDVVSTIASDAGPMHLFTPTTNLYVQGIGFYFTQSNQFLRISNQVETRVIRSLLQSPLIKGGHTNAPAGPEQTLKIFAETCHYALLSHLVNYAGQVHVIDPQLDMTSARLDIQLTSNNAVQNILASDHVVMTTTNHGRATADTSFYSVTNGDGTVVLTGNAVWRNGDEEARASQFIYEGARHLLTGVGNVRVRWPNPSGKFNSNSTAMLVGASGYRELFGDFVTLQLPPTNGPIENMIARGNVIIVNQADKSRALAGQAVYDRPTDHFELTGNPVWRNDQMEVKGQVLSADLSNNTYRAQTGSQFKLKNSPTQTVLITSESLEYQTNLATFTEHVDARVFESGNLSDTLTCQLLKVRLVTNQIETVFARGQVAGETATNLAGLKKTISCDQITVHRSVATGLLKNIEAEGHVVLQEIASAPIAQNNKLSADAVTARFSAVTNQLEQAIADQNVVLEQIKAGHTIHATSSHAVYDAGPKDQVRLTGTPLAHTDAYAISEADFMIWKPKANKFQAFGQYIIVPLKRKVSQHL